MIQKLEIKDAIILTNENTAIMIQITSLNDSGFTYRHIYYGRMEGIKSTGLNGHAKLFSIDGFNFYDWEAVASLERAKTQQKTGGATPMTAGNVVPKNTGHKEGELVGQWGKTAGMEYVQLDNEDVFFDYRRLNYQEMVGIVADQL